MFNEKVQVTFNSEDKDIYDYITSLGVKKATVIKKLIRESMWSEQNKVKENESIMNAENQQELLEKVNKILDIVQNSKMSIEDSRNSKIDEISAQIGDEEEEFNF